MEHLNVDPLLEEVFEMRRRIMAEHGNDWRKVLEYYGELGRQHREVGTGTPEVPGKSAA
jgi:hypothetical protein